MIMFALSDLGNIIKLEMTEEQVKSKSKLKVIDKAIVLDTDKSTFSLEYTSSFGEIVTDTITKNPKEIYDKLDKARAEIEKREIAFMKNLFIIDKHKYKIESSAKRKPRTKKAEENGK